jgi:hypothetical protein
MAKSLKEQALLIVADTSSMEVTAEEQERFGIFFFERGTALGNSQCLSKMLETITPLFDKVILARRDSEDEVVAVQPKKNYRFDKDVDLEQYDQIWCFAHAPTNRDPFQRPEFDQPDQVQKAIDHSASNALTDLEVVALDTWMKNKPGRGLFATGDHFVVGASMCSRIPRVGAMRRWTGYDLPPSSNGFDAICTLVPVGNDQADGREIVSSDSQLDSHAQQVQPVDYPAHPIVFNNTEHQEAFLLPDHMHEGGIREDGFVDRNASITLEDGTVILHFPKVNGQQPMPKVIARGKIAGAPVKFNMSFQDQPGINVGSSFTGRTVPLVNVYDGKLIGQARVVTDSTWHHWVDHNVNPLWNLGAGDYLRAYFTQVAQWLGGLPPVPRTTDTNRFSS